jgi:hypothetical protein
LRLTPCASAAVPTGAALRLVAVPQIFVRTNTYADKPAPKA